MEGHDHHTSRNNTPFALVGSQLANEAILRAIPTAAHGHDGQELQAYGLNRATRSKPDVALGLSTRISPSAG